MIFRPLLIIIGLLILAQILFFGSTQKDNTKILDRAIANVEDKIRQLRTEESDLKRQEKKLIQIVETIPPNLLVGFEDPETGFVEFMDYLQSPALEEVESGINIRSAQKFRDTPVPLHESQFDFDFHFLHTYEAESFLHYLISQKDHPLEIKSLRITRTPKGKPTGEILVSLVIPAKIQLPTIPSEKSEVK
jgi:hypothetical protein